MAAVACYALLLSSDILMVSVLALSLLRMVMAIWGEASMLRTKYLFEREGESFIRCMGVLGGGGGGGGGGATAPLLVVVKEFSIARNVRTPPPHWLNQPKGEHRCPDHHKVSEYR